MPTGDICVRNVVTTTPDKTIEEAAQLMRVNHVGDLLVIDRASGRRLLHGILTDRDIVVAVVALKLDPTAITVGDVMSTGLETAKEDQGILETMERIRSRYSANDCRLAPGRFDRDYRRAGLSAPRQAQARRQSWTPRLAAPHQQQECVRHGRGSRIPSCKGAIS